uniref:Dorsal-ventral patterning protein Sog n=1 Tax=Timema monikensis TaxID=170555 RepID=A0A7R9E5Y0_9NEOP|nr:unnamed protein product [Timema monikensis]
MSRLAAARKLVRACSGSVSDLVCREIARSTTKRIKLKASELIYLLRAIIEVMLHAPLAPALCLSCIILPLLQCSHRPDLPPDPAQFYYSDEEEKNMKHFAALLTGRTSLVLRREDTLLSPTTSHNSYNLVATARFTFHRKNLYYSFYTTEWAGRPRALQFVDLEGNILEEQALTNSEGVVASVYQNVTSKICGVWRRVPREYRRLLREEKMFVWLIWSGNERMEQSLSGQVARYRTLSTELFSSILQPAGTDYVSMHGSGGTAIVSAMSATPSIHIALVFNGVFAPDEVSDVSIVVRLELPEKQRVVLEEVVKVEKPAQELNVVEVQSAVSLSDLRQLTRGRLVLSVFSKRSPQELKLEGKVITRATCEIFQSPISSSESDSNEDDNDSESSETSVSGLSWLYVNREGGLVYNVEVSELPTDATPIIALVSGRGRKRVELEDLTPSFQSGWANGTINSLTPRELEQLYAGELAVNVATETDRSVVRGRLQQRLLADARDSPKPMLLKRQDVSTPATLVGMAWLAIDSECTLHYEVELSGLHPEDKDLTLNLESVPFLAPGAPVSRRLLEEFQGSQLEGFVIGISPMDLMQIEAGVSFLEIQDNKTVLLRARLPQIKIPTNCLPQHRDNDVPANPQTQTHGDVPPEQSTCYHDGRFYEEGTQWSLRGDPCTMCNCHYGRVKCDAVMCPLLSCGPEGVIKAHSSSPQDYNSSSTRGCYMAGHFYGAGSSWHPYLPPNGFDTCTICTCNANTLEVQYQRTQCPPLDCNEQTSFRPDKKACCKQCPAVIPPDTELLRDQPANTSLAHKSPEDILAEGGCKYPVGGPYENGKEWHPRVYLHGEIKCVKCRCKDGKVKCERKRCSRSPCSQSGKRRNTLSFSDGGDECCTLCRRNRRNHRQPAKS